MGCKGRTEAQARFTRVHGQSLAFVSNLQPSTLPESLSNFRAAATDGGLFGLVALGVGVASGYLIFRADLFAALVAPSDATALPL